MKPGIKEQVKLGELTADQGMTHLLRKARAWYDAHYVKTTRTWRWLEKRKR